MGDRALAADANFDLHEISEGTFRGQGLLRMKPLC